MKILLFIKSLILTLNIFNNYFLITTKAYSKDSLTLSECSENDIKQYYGDLSNKNGDELKNYLYQIISNNNNFVSYESISNWYKITDRNYDISNKIDNINEYDFKNDTGLTYYTYNMYVSSQSNNDINKAFSNAVNSLTVNKDVNRVTYRVENDKVIGERPNSYIQVDKEHVWPKNHGFKVVENGKDILNKGAPTDLHNLVAADHNTNSAGHNDNYYGEVVNKEGNEIYAYLSDGSRELSGWLGYDKNELKVFEPTDEWKGNIARCLFYMATRYSIKKNINSQEEPFLVLTDDLNLKEQADIFHGVHYNLSTLINWHKLDPVDKYEKYRNDLIYNNVQRNRNPYIDYPNLVDRVFSNEYDFSQLKEKYNLHLNQQLKLDIALPKSDSLSFLEKIEYNQEYLKQISDNEFQPIKSGETSLKYIIANKTNNGNKKEFITNIYIKDNISFNKIDEIRIKSFQTTNINLEINNLFDNEKVEYRSINNLVSINDNQIKAKIFGRDKIEVYIITDENEVLLTTIEVIIEPSIVLIIVFISIIVLVIIIIVMIIIFQKKKKKTK